jgi:radical SAM protein with 4Fe4S-binding SPASM domain
MEGTEFPSFSVRVKASEYTLWKGDGPLLNSLDMELTERCNNNCMHCYINLPANDPSQKRELSTDEVKEILAEAATLGALSVRFTGGEPLIRDDFQEVYTFARTRGLRVLLFTNACLITPELADLFSRIPPLEKIEVTVYGLTRESYEGVTRVKGSYDQFRRGVDLLLAKEIPFVVKSALLPPNRHEQELLEKWAGTLPAVEKPLTFTLLLDLRGRRDSLAKNQNIQRLRPFPDEYVALLSRDRETYLAGMKEFCSRFLVSSGDALFPCGAGQKICIDAYGLVQPCLLLRHPDLLYDLKRGSIKEALAYFARRLHEMRSTNPLYLSRCARCFLKGLCEQCPARSWMEHGDLDTPVDYFCEVTHALACDLGLLQPGEKAWEVENAGERIQLFVGSSS